ncbi:hypothetical protein ACFFQW_35230 [Umezawaea endophytica]|uniref:Uncharacterized protein n=1 Tax=Umezawaea endophytica TaxID=1654476 RepID=A0A9X2VFL4_9PSEU|nr:hypothetical protein [Umezawaea endophytica]MCS7475655.1 hypothetical protein [Umezawaea endophytica]
MLVGTTDPGVCVASKRRGSVAPYVALVIAVIIFVPALRDAVLGWLPPLLDSLKDLNPFRS